MSNDQGIRVYEDYQDAAEKHRAQRGARRGRPTGKARGYVFILFDEGGHLSGTAPIFLLDPGSDAVHTMTTTGVSQDYLRPNGRRVGKKYLPKVWADYLKHLETPEP